MFISKRCHCSSKNCRCSLAGKETKKLSRELALLSAQSRLEILFTLYQKKHCVCDLVKHTDFSQSLVSHHLADLAKADMVKKERQGKFFDYRLTPKGVRFLKALMTISGEEVKK